MLPAGSYPGVVALVQTEAGPSACQFGESKEKGTPFAAVMIRILRGPHATKTITWQGYFAGGATEHTIKALRNFGFTGDDLATFPTQTPDNEVEFVVNHETNNEGKTFARVGWVNSPNRGMTIAKPLAGAELRKFGAAFKAHLKSAPVVVGTKAVVEEPGSEPEGQSDPSDNFDQSAPDPIYDPFA